MRITTLVLAIFVLFPACSGSSVKKKKADDIINAIYVKRAAVQPDCDAQKKETLQSTLKKYKISKSDWKEFVKNNTGFVRAQRKKAIARHCSAGTEARLAKNAPGKMAKGADKGDKGDHGRGDAGRPENSGGPLSAPQQEAINDMWDIVGQ